MHCCAVVCNTASCAKIEVLAKWHTILLHRTLCRQGEGSVYEGHIIVIRVWLCVPSAASSYPLWIFHSTTRLLLPWKVDSDLLKEYCEWAIFVANHFCCISLLHCPLWVTLLLVWSCLANRSTEHNLCVPHVVELWSYTHVTNFSLDETAILRKLYNLNKIVVLRVH